MCDLMTMELVSVGISVLWRLFTWSVYSDYCGEGAGAVVVKWFECIPQSYLRKGSCDWYGSGMPALAFRGPGFNCVWFFSQINLQPALSWPGLIVGFWESNWWNGPFFYDTRNVPCPNWDHVYCSNLFVLNCILTNDFESFVCFWRRDTIKMDATVSGRFSQKC
jgi:hypothetical protein